ncbi:C-C motif chemokine 3-like [Cololabis saira]|uniref:C-C motif chemokine 3-like n=1 Tax=Cololabis saira TaxID=129043 RepID=UPI002AD3CAC7|nr:C-C motif chemokine 3-like [Cololabis saira]
MAAPRLSLSVFVLMLAVVTLTEGLRGAGPRKCCFNFIDKPVPESRVTGYVKTSQRCSSPAILLKTVVGRQLCVRPSAQWVKELIGNLDAKVALGDATHL